MRQDDIPNLEVLDLVSDGDLLVQHASQVVTMGGYNTISAILAWRKRALVVPRVSPRKEQLIRASRLSELGHISMLHPDALTPQGIARWVNEPHCPVDHLKFAIDFDGLDRICELIGVQFPQVNSSQVGCR